MPNVTLLHQGGICVCALTSAFGLSVIRSSYGVYTIHCCHNPVDRKAKELKLSTEKNNEEIERREVHQPVRLAIVLGFGIVQVTFLFFHRVAKGRSSGRNSSDSPGNDRAIVTTHTNRLIEGEGTIGACVEVECFGLRPFVSLTVLIKHLASNKILDVCKGIDYLIVIVNPFVVY